MADILYTYKDQVYANITNKCNCRCRFCIRSHEDGVGDADTLWHKTDPTLEQIKEAMDAFDFAGYKELSIRVNTNGLANLYYGKDVIPLLAQAVDSVSISLNAPTSEQYNEVSRPQLDNAFEGLLQFATECKGQIPSVKLTIVDVLPKEEIEACKKLAASLDIPLRIRKYA